MAKLLSHHQKKKKKKSKNKTLLSLYFLLDFSQHIHNGFYIVVTSLDTCFILFPGAFF